MEKRQRPRLRWVLPCRVATAAGRRSGVIRDVSDRGLFVETEAHPTPNSVVELLFDAHHQVPDFSFIAGVARTRRSPAHLASALPSGIGLEVIPPREAFERWILAAVRPRLPEPECVGLAPLGASRQTGPGRYRVRLIRQDRPGSQIVTLRCESEEDARRTALSRMDGLWRVADSQPA